MLKLIEFADRDEHRRRLTLLSQHNTLVAMLSTGHEFVEMITGFWHRERKRHGSDVTPGSRHFDGAARARGRANRYCAVTEAAGTYVMALYC